MKDHSRLRTHDIPEASLRRLPIYYRCLQQMRTAGVVHVSCADLARALGLEPTQVRKDIEMTGIVGKPRVGYGMKELVAWLENFLGWNRPKEAVLVGAGSLGSALLGYGKFPSHGLEIVAVFDIDPEKIGQRVKGREVQPLLLLPEFIHRTGALVGVITTPASAAQSVTDLMVSAGIRAIWNFAPAYLHVPQPVILQNEDFYHSLASISYKLENSMRVRLIENGNSYGEEN